MVSVSFEVVECRGGLNAKAEYRLVLFSTGDRDGEPKSAYKQGASVVAWDKPFESLTLPIAAAQVPIDVRAKPNSWSRHGHNVCSYILNLTHDCNSQTFELDAIKSKITPPPRLSITITVTGLAIAENSIPVVSSTIPSTIATPSPSGPVQDAPELATASPSIAATEGVNEILSSARLASEDASHEQARVRTRSFPLAGVVENAPASDLADVGDAMVSGLSHLDALAQIIDIASDIHPLVKGVWSLFNVAYTLIKQQSELDGKIKTLIEALDANCSFAGALATNQNTAAAESILRSIIREVLNGATLVKEYCVVRKSKLSVFKFIGSPIASQVDACLEVLDTFRRELGDHTTASIHHDLQSLASTLSRELESLRMKSDRVEKFVESQENKALLAQMPYAPEADRALRSDERGCLPTTRSEIIEAIINWAIGAETDASQTYIHGLHPDSRVLWLCGVAGSGKSSIAISVARALHSMGRLVALYGFEAAFQTSLNPTNLFSTIARQRAESRPAQKWHLLRTLEPMDRHQRATTSTSEQFKLLLTALSPENTTPFDDIVIIDAFDESGSVSQRAAALLALSPEAQNSAFPSGLRFIITSRYDLDVARRLESVRGSDQPMCLVLHMEDIHPRHTERDIERYVNHMLNGTYGLEAAQAAGNLARLAVTAEHSFQWASTACRYIIDSDDHDGARLPDERLQETLEMRGGLDQLYLSVLNQSFGESMSRESPATRSLRMILGTLVCAREPVTIQMVAAFASATQSGPTVQLAGFHILARQLSSIITGTQNTFSPLVAFHTSFTDFLQDEQRSERYTVSSSETHLHLASASLAVMKQSLRFNICRLETSFLRNDAVPDLRERVKRYIPDELSYACCFWPVHVAEALSSDSPGAESLRYSLSDFLENKLRLLQWLEVMSLTSTNAYASLGPLLSLQATNRDLSDLLLLITYFSIPISLSVPHIYLSALAFAPSLSTIAPTVTHFPNLVRSDRPLSSWPQIRHTLEHLLNVQSVAWSPYGRLLMTGEGKEGIFTADTGGAINVWDVYRGNLMLPRVSTTSAVLSVAISPDGNLLATGHQDATVQLWDAHTLAEKGSPLKGHSDYIRSVAFSPTDSLLASGSDDKSVALWDLVTGSMVGDRLKGHSSLVRSVAFSPDGALLLSGSDDGTIRLWDVRTHSAMGNPLAGHTDRVCCGSFSPDGSLLASGSDDKTVRLWDVRSGTPVGQPLAGHVDWVQSIAFSPDGQSLASCSDDRTVRIWDVRDRSEAGEPLTGHTDYINSVAFSPNGALLASGSSDKTVYVWDARVLALNRESPATPFKITDFAAFSPDGKLLASGSDGHAIQLWDVHSLSPLGAPLKGHTNSINCVAFSPDGTLLASGSDHKTVRLWDVRTGSAIGEPLRGHSSSVLALAFSRESKLLASASDDKTIRFWDTHARSASGEPLTGHSRGVLSVAFSPDGSTMASGDYGGTVRLWDVQTRSLIGQALKGHSDWVRCLVFSPDGTLLVSGSDDGTIRIWNVGTHSAVGIGHADNATSLAFSSNGALLASCSQYNNVVRVWDVRVPPEVGEPVALLRHESKVKSIAFLSAAPILSSIAGGGVVREWDLGYLLSASSSDLPRNTEERLKEHTLSQLPDHPDLTALFPDFLVSLDDGWVIGQNNELVLWIPPALRPLIDDVRVIARFGGPPRVKLDFSHFVSGSDWADCYSPPSTPLSNSSLP